MFTIEKSEILTYKYSSVMPQPTNKDECHFDIQPSSRAVRYPDESLYHAFTSHFLIHSHPWISAQKLLSLGDPSWSPQQAASL